MTYCVCRFGVCPDAVQTEAEGHVFYQTVISLEGDPEETLNFLATWPNEQDQSETFLVATLDYRYRQPTNQRYS